MFHIWSPSTLPFLYQGQFFVVDHELAISVVNYPLQSKGPVYDVVRPLVGKSVLVATGTDWKRMRKLISKAFSNRVMLNVHHSAVNILQDKAFPYFDRERRIENVRDFMQQLSLDILGIVSFSYDFGGVDDFIGGNDNIENEDKNDEKFEHDE